MRKFRPSLEQRRRRLQLAAVESGLPSSGRLLERTITSIRNDGSCRTTILQADDVADLAWLERLQLKKAAAERQQAQGRGGRGVARDGSVMFGNAAR